MPTLNPGIMRGLSFRRARSSSLSVNIDGYGVVILTGLKRVGVEIPYACKIMSSKLDTIDATTGSIVIDIYRLSGQERFAGVAPSSSYSICSQNKPTLTSEARQEDTGLSGWDRLLYPDDWLYFNVDSVTSLLGVTLTLTFRRELV